MSTTRLSDATRSGLLRTDPGGQAFWLLPGPRILGLSKPARLVQHFAAHLRVQERLTRQVADWLAERQFVAFWLAAGRVVAGMNVNVWDVTSAIQELIRSGQRVDPDRLADPDLPLDDLTPGRRTGSGRRS